MELLRVEAFLQLYSLLDQSAWMLPIAFITFALALACFKDFKAIFWPCKSSTKSNSHPQGVPWQVYFCQHDDHDT